jgi:hypothetical protein
MSRSFWSRWFGQGRLDQLEVIPEHESGFRRMVADARDHEYEAFRSLEEARDGTDASVVMEGDDGGSIYLTCPVSLVRCDETTLGRLLNELDVHVWNDPEMAGLFYERAPIGTGIAGGTGGGIVTEGVWLHP